MIGKETENVAIPELSEDHLQLTYCTVHLLLEILWVNNTVA